ncbi:helix-turn-helix domain-containing protein [Rhodococcus olei]|uniref:helix-turn-helix domain-containing protein n=1 Tax=Rhodococcus olei TaxID=2161675 RepID=UPI003CD0B8A2
MTTLKAAADRESRTEAIARRLRGKLGEMRISQSELARVIHMNKASVSRRMAGDFPWRIDELELVCDALGLDLDEILTGQERKNPHPDIPGGGLRLPRLDSNQQPSD